MVLGNHQKGNNGSFTHAWKLWYDNVKRWKVAYVTVAENKTNTYLGV